MSVNKFVLNETSYFGKGAREELPREIRKRGFKKVLVVTDHSLIDCKIAEKITSLLDANGIEYDVFAEVKPNPTVTNCKNGIKKCREINNK